MKPTRLRPRILPIIFLISVFILISILDGTRSPSPNTRLQTRKSSSFSSSTSTSASASQMKILMGIMTLPEKFHHRNFLRQVYNIESRIQRARVDIKFVFCNLTEQHKHRIALEIMSYNDIIVLNCEENMDQGKTYTFFSSLPKMFPSESTTPPYDYVMKVDDDAYFRLQSLVDSLKPLPKHDLYYGRTVPCKYHDPRNHYMSGMGYLVSWDIVEWISVSDIPKSNTIGPEDKLFERWLREGKRGRNRHNAEFGMYDFPEPWTRCSHEMWPNTVAVHYLKSEEKWFKTLDYFNVTSRFNASNRSDFKHEREEATIHR